MKEGQRKDAERKHITWAAAAGGDGGGGGEAAKNGGPLASEVERNQPMLMVTLIPVYCCFQSDGD